MRPIVAENPDTALKIATGAYYRLNTSLDYCDSMLAHMMEQDRCGTTPSGSLEPGVGLWDVICGD